MVDQKATVMLDVMSGPMTGISSTIAGFSELTYVMEHFTHNANTMMGSMTGPMMAAGALAGVLGSKFAMMYGEYERGMDVVMAVSGQTEQQIGQLGNTAKQFSVQYKMGLDEMTEGLATLGRAGLSSASAQTDVLKSSLQLAKLEGMDLTTALEGVVQTASLLGADIDNIDFGKQSKYVSELMLATSMSSPLKVQDIFQTLKYSGGVAALAGANLEPQNDAILKDYMGTISAFGLKGVSGDMAGTALRAFLNKPASQDKTVTEGLDMIGLTPDALWDKSGEKMLPISDQLALIKSHMRDLSKFEQIDVWGKIVGPKMGQQMMKIDPSDIKKQVSKIEGDMNMDNIFDKSVDNLASSWESFTKQMDVNMVGVGERFAAYIQPPLDLLTQFMAFLDNPATNSAVFIGMFVLIKEGIKAALGFAKQLMGTLSNFGKGNVKQLDMVHGLQEAINLNKILSEAENRGIITADKRLEVEKALNIERAQGAKLIDATSRAVQKGQTTLDSFPSASNKFGFVGVDGRFGPNFNSSNIPTKNELSNEKLSSGEAKYMELAKRYGSTQEAINKGIANDVLNSKAALNLERSKRVNNSKDLEILKSTINEKSKQSNLLQQEQKLNNALSNAQKEKVLSMLNMQGKMFNPAMTANEFLAKNQVPQNQSSKLLKTSSEFLNQNKVVYGPLTAYQKALQDISKESGKSQTSVNKLTTEIGELTYRSQMATTSVAMQNSRMFSGITSGAGAFGQGFRQSFSKDRFLSDLPFLMGGYGFLDSTSMGQSYNMRRYGLSSKEGMKLESISKGDNSTLAMFNDGTAKRIEPKASKLSSVGAGLGNAIGGIVSTMGVAGVAMMGIQVAMEAYNTGLKNYQEKVQKQKDYLVETQSNYDETISNIEADYMEKNPDATSEDASKASKSAQNRVSQYLNNKIGWDDLTSNEQALVNNTAALQQATQAYINSTKDNGWFGFGVKGGLTQFSDWKDKGMQFYNETGNRYKSDALLDLNNLHYGKDGLPTIANELQTSGETNNAYGDVKGTLGYLQSSTIKSFGYGSSGTLAASIGTSKFSDMIGQDVYKSIQVGFGNGFTSAMAGFSTSLNSNLENVIGTLEANDQYIEDRFKEYDGQDGGLVDSTGKTVDIIDKVASDLRDYSGVSQDTAYQASTVKYMDMLNQKATQMLPLYQNVAFTTMQQSSLLSGVMSASGSSANTLLRSEQIQQSIATQLAAEVFNSTMEQANKNFELANGMTIAEAKNHGTPAQKAAAEKALAAVIQGTSQGSAGRQAGDPKYYSDQQSLAMAKRMMTDPNYYYSIIGTQAKGYFAQMKKQDNWNFLDSTSTGKSGTGGTGTTKKEDNGGSGKIWTNLAICGKKMIPKLNVNLFKTPPRFLINNQNLKFRDINVNSIDKPKKITNAVKNAVIDIQNQTNPKIIQDEAGVYDPAGATDGDNIPSGKRQTT